jgi:hypothetical protein
LIRPRRMSPDAWQPILAAHWRVKNGLEHRALVCLLRAPRALEEARRRLLPSDFLTPAYAGLAAVLLDANLGSRAAEVARGGLAGRPYLPDPGRFDWEAEATVTVARLLERRSRWRQERRGLPGGLRG